MNYLNNALKVTEEGSVSIEVRIHLDDGGSEQLTIRLRDTGCGIPPESQEQLFKLFLQVDSSSTRKHGGLGLGLALSARLADIMGGSVGLESTPGVGSTFWVKLPLRIVEPGSAINEALSAEDGEQMPELNGLRVLIAEDNAINQKVIVQMLTKLGCQCSLAENGKAAVSLYEDNRYDLVLMDCQIPEMDGYEATEQIRRLEQARSLARTPVVALTALGMEGDRDPVFGPEWTIT